MLILGIFRNLQGNLWLYSKLVRICPPFSTVRNLLKEGLDGLGTKLMTFSQTHWAAAHHKSWPTGVWHCQECPRTDLLTNSGVVSFDNLWLAQWFQPDRGLGILVAMPRICGFPKLHRWYQIQPVWEPWIHVPDCSFPLWGLQPRINIEQGFLTWRAPGRIQPASVFFLSDAVLFLKIWINHQYLRIRGFHIKFKISDFSPKKERSRSSPIMVTIGWALSWGEWFQFAADPPWTIVSPVLICHFLLPLCCQFFMVENFTLYWYRNRTGKIKAEKVALHLICFTPWWWGPGRPLEPLGFASSILAIVYACMCMCVCTCVCEHACVFWG